MISIVTMGLSNNTFVFNHLGIFRDNWNNSDRGIYSDLFHNRCRWYARSIQAVIYGTFNRLQMQSVSHLSW